MSVPKLPPSLFEPRKGPETSTAPERLTNPYRPVWIDPHVAKQMDLDHISHDEVPRQVPAGEMIREASHRECVYKDPELVALYPDGCAGYLVTEECCLRTDVYWVRAGRPDKLVDPDKKSDVTQRQVYVVVCPDGTITIVPPAQPGNLQPPAGGQPPAAEPHPRRDGLIPVEIPGSGHTSVGPGTPPGVVPGKEYFWKLRRPVVYTDPCHVTATYVWMVRSVTVTGPPVATAKGPEEVVAPETTRTITYDVCIPAPATARAMELTAPRHERNR